MAREVMILTTKEISENLFASEGAKSCYEFAMKNAGLDMDEGAVANFVAQRNAKSGWRDLWELKAWCEKTAASIKEVSKHTFNVGTAEELPSYVKWTKQSYTYEFQEGAAAAVAEALIKKRLVTKEQLLNTVSVAAMVKAAGLTTEKLMDMFPDTILEKPKERTLSIK
ncbi:MAG: hypothetical protein MJY87_02515 [Fibrobacter sp.]|nr:hypothetical protein [Fibrobacter sp.]